MKRKLTLLAAVLLSVPFAAQAFQYQGLFYRVLDEEAAIVEVYNTPYTQVEGDLVIPSVVVHDDKAYRVTSIGGRAFYECSGLTSISIPEGVTSIGSNAFKGCDGLRKAEFASIESLLGISFGLDSPGISFEDMHANPLAYAQHLFIAGEEITDLVIPDGIETIGAYTFANLQGLASVSIPSSVTKIGRMAFAWCAPERVEFASLKCLFGISFENGNANPLWGARHLFIDGKEITDLIIPDGVETIEGLLFCGLTGLTSVYISDSVTTIGRGAFEDCTGLTSVDIPASVTVIGESAFKGCTGLTSVDIPASVTWIANSAFEGCTGLTCVDIPENVTSIGWNAYMGCTGLTSVDIPERVSSIGDNAFMGCTALKSVNLHEGLTSIAYDAFGNCTSLRSISIPGSVTSIGPRAFAGCDRVTTLSLADGIEPIVIYENAFPEVWELYLGRNTDYSFCSPKLDTLTVGNLVTSLPSFGNCSSLCFLTLGTGIKSIPDEAFWNCGLTDVVLPPSVEEIGLNAFSGNKITKVYMGGSTSLVEERAFYRNSVEEVYVGATDCPEAAVSAFSDYTGTLYVPGASLDAYRNAASCWDRFGSYQPLVEPKSFIGLPVEVTSSEPGSTVQLRAVIEPAEVSMPYIFWESSNPETATVDNNGLVTFRGDLTAGCLITARTLYAGVEPVVFDLRGAATGIVDVTVGDGDAAGSGAYGTMPDDIFTITGVCVKRGATADDIQSLQPGVYIIGGRKVAVR